MADDEPPALQNPFGRSATREDALPGYLELSDGSLHVGKLYLTRDMRLKVVDEQAARQREIPLAKIQRIDVKIDKEWLEKEWRFKENANDEKVFTGRSYPAREYSHVVTLTDGRQIAGSVSTLIYVEPYRGSTREKHLLHKRDKGPVGSNLAALVYVRTVELGEAAQRAALQRQAEQEQAAKRK